MRVQKKSDSPNHGRSLFVVQHGFPAGSETKARQMRRCSIRTSNRHKDLNLQTLQASGCPASSGPRVFRDKTYHKSCQVPSIHCSFSACLGAYFYIPFFWRENDGSLRVKMTQCHPMSGCGESFRSNDPTLWNSQISGRFIRKRSHPACPHAR